MDLRNHTAAAVVAALVGALAGAGAQHLMPGKERIVEKQTQVTIAASKHAWPDLTQDETIAIGEQLAALKGVRVYIFCNDAACDDLAHDIDDAMEIAGAVSTLDRPAFPPGYGFAVAASKGDQRARVLADAISRATSGRLSPVVLISDTADGAIQVIIGKHR